MSKITTAFRIYKQKGLKDLIDKSSGFLKQRFKNRGYAIDPIDSYCYRESVSELEKRKRIEDGIDDILNTTGYTVCDFDAVRPDEIKNHDNPYSGYGQFPGKYNGLGLYSSIKMSQERNSIKELAKTVVEEDPTTILEIGSARGGSFYIWCRYIDSAEVLVSLDLRFPGRRDRFFQQFSAEKEIIAIEGDSQKEQTYELVNDHISTRDVDFLYIDASHKYSDVKYDFERYSRLLGGSGMIGLHDITHPGTGVPQFWEELQNEYETEEFGRGTVKNGLVWL
jgi:predicted O-methyltransferase YrrM